MCKCLDIHHSVYYYHCNHKENSYEKTNKKLDIEIKKIYNHSKGRYGSPKITKVLNNKGLKVSQKRVARRMKFLGLRSITVKKFNHAGNKKIDDEKEYQNLLEQDFFAENPSEKWVGDITYIYTKETRWTYLAIVMDLFDLSKFYRQKIKVCTYMLLFFNIFYNFLRINFGFIDLFAKV